MIKNIKTLIIPDVHGREFWKEPVYDILENYPEANIVFLGDYHDPYSYESINHETSLANFKEIVQLKKNNPDRIHLLIGNHDCSYITSPNICNCRHDYLMDKEFRNIYWENHELFEIAYSDGDFLFSHAGIIPDWVVDNKQFWAKRNDVDVADFLNTEFQNSFNDDSNGFWGALSSIGFTRGGIDNAGSIVWGDMREHIRQPFMDYIQVFGHTQQEELPIHYKDSYIDEFGNTVNHEFYNLDCRQAFYLGYNNLIHYYSTDKIVQGVKTLFNNWIW